LIPRLTIILTCRDKYELLRFAVKSVIKQTYKAWELIVADDASEDPRIRDYLVQCESTDPRIRVFWGQPVSESYRKLHKMNAMRINAAIHMAEGEYISYLGDDNVYLQRRCEQMMHVLEKDGPDMVVDRVRWVMFDGRERDQDDFKYAYKMPHEPGHEKVLSAIAPSNYICTDSVIHRKPRPCCMDWPTDIQHDTPVDWRYWCYLVNKLGYSVRKLNHVGERAYFPGTWRNGVTIKQVMRHRQDVYKEADMPKLSIRKKKRKKAERMTKRQKATDSSTGKVWCVNTSGTTAQILQNDGKPIVVPPDGRIEEDKVAIYDSEGKRRGVFPGFSYDSRVETPSIKDVLAARPEAPNVEYETDAQGINASLATEPEKFQPVVRKVQAGAPLPDRRRRTVDSRRPVEKRPVDEMDGKNMLCTECGKPIYAGNKSGLCRACYNASRKKVK